MSEGLSSRSRHCLLVSCHPLADSLCNHLVARVSQGFAEADIEIEHLDLYAGDFVAPLSAAERQGYHSGKFDATALTREIADLQRAEILVLVFPTWWFGMPALLKGWFDRVWAPGVAFDQPDKVGGRITPKLDGLKQCLVITTLGSPWWVDRLVARRPLKRILSRVLIGACAPTARFEMLSVYSAMALDQRRLERFMGRIDRAVTNIIRRASR
jgi:NAD(P)H dehydrogenase (quinone)